MKWLSVLVCIVRLPSYSGTLVSWGRAPRKSEDRSRGSFLPPWPSSVGLQGPSRPEGQQEFGFPKLKPHFVETHITEPCLLFKFHLISGRLKNVLKYPAVYFYNNASNGSELVLVLLQSEIGEREHDVIDRSPILYYSQRACQTRKSTSGHNANS